MSFFTAIIGFLAPLMIALSPVLSYGDQALAMHRNKSSAGFSLDIPLIMLIASFLRYVMSRQTARARPSACFPPPRRCGIAQRRLFFFLVVFSSR